VLSKLLHKSVYLITLFAIIIMPVSGVFAQGENAAQPELSGLFGITLEGPIDAINLNVITISGITVELASDDPILTTLKIGDVVQVEGGLSQETDALVVQADSVTVTNSGIFTPIIAINGPVGAVNLNMVTLFGFNIQFNPNDPVLADLSVGDIIDVSGNIIVVGGTIIIIPIEVIIIVDNPGAEATPALTPTPGGTLQATVVADDDDDDDTIIVIEGPVQEININIITIYDIDIHIDPDDPILDGLEIGDILHIEGNFAYDGDVIIIVAVTVVVVNVVIIDSGPGVPAGCKLTGKGNGKLRLKCSNKGSKKSS
jgi:hypothetical protein